jgi:acetyl-CoA carboxylase carboxyl transferase subunit beta
MWFRKKQKPSATPEDAKAVKVPKGLWTKCEACGQIMFAEAVQKNLMVCPKCDFHFHISSRERLAMLYDEGGYEELFEGLQPQDPLSFQDLKPYSQRIVQYQRSSGEKEAIIVAKGNIGGTETISCVMEYSFMGGSMGSVVGEKIKRAIDVCLGERLPLVIVSSSGGARMQESVFSLMQMAKVSSALAELHQANLPYISIMTDPTTGGVTASYAMLGDVHLAEPGALIGFAGPRVIEQTIRQKLPPYFQKSEFLLEKGMVDIVVTRAELKETLARLLSLMTKKET